MNINEAIDTLSEEEVNENKVRLLLAYALNINEVLEVLRNIVDSSDCLDFKSSRARKYITASRPELVLDLDINKSMQKYPELKGDLASKDPETVRLARTQVVNKEVTDEMVAFYKATLMYIKTNDFHVSDEKQKDRVLEVVKNIDLKDLRDSIANIFPLDEEGEETGFSFSVISGVSFASGEDILEDSSAYVEIIY